MNKNHWAYTQKRESVLKKISEKLKGRKPSSGSFKKGGISPRKGIKLSKEQIEKIKASRLKSGGWIAWNKGIKTGKGGPKGKKSKDWLEKISKSLSGRKVWNKGKGIDRGLRALICSSSQYIQWRKKVFSRDGFKCIWCGSKKRIEADHIKAFAIICYENKIDSLKKAFKCKELWDINNGRTLCRGCHKKTDTFCAKTKTK